MKLNMDQNFENRFKFTLESARKLTELDKSHPCSQLHGHSFKVTLVFKGPLDEKYGWLIDFNEIELATAPLRKKLDHKLLNDIPGLDNPTSELICTWIYWKLKKQTQFRKVAELLAQVRISETPNTECSFPAG